LQAKLHFLGWVGLTYSQRPYHDAGAAQLSNFANVPAHPAPASAHTLSSEQPSQEVKAFQLNPPRNN
jgi:hypothetical protein